ncbi:Protein GrpE [bacterium HR21]|jgi:molecular chaperone GrpE|nr:Protein GrpE [bacterium HR21]
MSGEIPEELKPSPDLTEKLRQTYLQHESASPGMESTPEPEAEEPAAQHTALEEELAQLRQQYEELREQHLRLAADFDNYRKRMLREREAWAETLTEHLLRQLLPIADQLEMALQLESSEEALRRGVELIYRNLMKLLETLGVKPIDVSPGQPFDVYYHEAVLRLPSELPEGTIVKELQRGYLFRERVLRHARVAVSTGAQDDHHASQQDQHDSASATPEASS